MGPKQVVPLREPRSNVNEGMLHTAQIWSHTIRCNLVSYEGNPFLKGSYPLVGDTVSVF